MCQFNFYIYESSCFAVHGTILVSSHQIFASQHLNNDITIIALINKYVLPQRKQNCAALSSSIVSSTENRTCNEHKNIIY